MKRKLRAGLLAAVLTVTVFQAGIDTVQAEETNNKYYTSGVIVNEEKNTEICVGDNVEIGAGVYLRADDSAVALEKWDWISDAEMKELAEAAEISKDFTYYEPDPKWNNNWVAFDGSIPEAAFGQYVSEFYGVVITEEDGTVEYAFNWADSERTVHSWGGTANITFERNSDEKTVRVYSICDSLNTANIPDKITVGGKTYKVTAIVSNANENKNLKSVTIASGITSIGKNAFKGAKKLKTITIKGNVKAIDDNAFAGINNKAVFKIKADAGNYARIVSRIKKAGAPKTATFKRIK